MAKNKDNNLWALYEWNDPPEKPPRALSVRSPRAWPALIKRASAGRRPTDMRIERVTFGFEDYNCRTPIKFGGSVVKHLALLNVHCTVRNAHGKTTKGFGSMPLSNVWSFPSRTVPYETTLKAMKTLSGRIASLTGDCRLSGHPIDIYWQLEPEYLRAAAEVSRELALAAPIPKLCTLVVASPFDAALHDAFGKLHGRSVYQTYGPDFMAHDLAHYLGPEFKGEYLDRYILTAPKSKMPLYHLVGAADPILETDIPKRLNDGLPETLPEWIQRDGLTHLKIKLNGSDLKWDLERVLNIEQVASQTQRQRGCAHWYYSLDFNERCPNAQYLLDFLDQLKAKSPKGFERIQYIEQPTSRDLRARQASAMHAASRLRPVVIDESLTDLESLKLAREMGYTGAALKACKGQSHALLMAAAAQKFKMFLCVQDLTCPGASLIHSAGLAAHVPGVAAIEANARQYLPAANIGWEHRFPGIFKITDGMLKTSGLNGMGLGAVPASESDTQRRPFSSEP